MRTRWFVVTLAVLSVLVLCEAAVRVAAPHLPDPAPWPSPESRIKAAQMEETDCVRVAFMGTSVTEAAVDPDVLGVSSYNAALPFSTLQSVTFWAEEFVLPGVCPETVVLGIPTWSPGFAAGGGTERLLAGLENVVRFRRPEGRLSMVLHHSELIRRRGQLKSLAEQWTHAYRPERAGLISPSGFQVGYEDETIGELPPPDPSVVAARVDRQALTEFVDTVRASGALVVFMVEPTRCDPFGVCPVDEVRDEILREYQAVAAATDTDVINIWDDFEPALYADPSHLNHRGAERFTNALRTELVRLGIIP